MGDLAGGFRCGASAGDQRDLPPAGGARYPLRAQKRLHGRRPAQTARLRGGDGQGRADAVLLGPGPPVQRPGAEDHPGRPAGGRLVTEKKTAELTAKVAALGGSHRGEILQQNVVRFNTRKHTNESIYFSVNELEQALTDRCQASFYYFDLNEKHEKVFRKDRQLYVVDPVALVFVEDNYYLMCWSAKYAQIVSYRVDRMETVTALKTPVCPEALMPEEQIAAFTEETFKMFGGEPEEVTLRFANELIGTIYDKFGEDTQMLRVDPDSCAARVKVQVSPTFWGWVFQFRGKLQITDPQKLIDTYKALLEAASE